MGMGGSTFLPCLRSGRGVCGGRTSGSSRGRIGCGGRLSGMRGRRRGGWMILRCSVRCGSGRGGVGGVLGGGGGGGGGGWVGGGGWGGGGGRGGGGAWVDWDKEVRVRKASAVRKAAKELAGELDYHRFVQFLFDRQWEELRRYAHERGVGLIGDIPIFVSHDGVDVWCNQGLFVLEKNGRPRRVTGVPPDLFSETGQRWGHPQYDWGAHQRSGFEWWVERLGAAFRRFDAMRIDHFLGFRRVWSIS